MGWYLADVVAWKVLQLEFDDLDFVLKVNDQLTKLLWVDFLFIKFGWHGLLLAECVHGLLSLHLWVIWHQGMLLICSAMHQL